MGRITVALLALAVSATFALSTLRAEDEKPKMTIKDAMKLHAKEKLHEKVKKGEASKEELDKLIEAYEALGKNKPPKGSADNWKKLTDELLAATKDAKEGKEGAAKRYEAAVNCMQCHKEHK
jgi:hypothetical protein